jgi:hypothetical protein
MKIAGLLEELTTSIVQNRRNDMATGMGIQFLPGL